MNTRYLLKRLALFLLTLWLGATAIFIIPRLAPGDPVQAMIGRLMTAGQSVENGAELIAAWRTRLGLDQPLLGQYLRFLGNALRFDNGYSLAFFPAQVDTLIRRSMPWTLGLLLLATLIAFVVGNLIGALLAWRGTPRPVAALLPLSLVFTSIPAFMLGICLIYLFSYLLDWLPYAGGHERTLEPALELTFLLSMAKHAILPAASVVLVRMGAWALGMRGMMVTTDGEDYMLLAQAKGLAPWRRFWHYGIRNAILPQVTALGVAIGSIAGGFVIVELIFSYPGIGYLLYQAILNNDYTLIQGVVFYIIAGVALAVLLLDLLYPLIDPRIRQG